MHEADLTFAKDGMEAIEKVLANNYDLIFMDNRMPKLSGVEAIKQIRLLNKTVKIVFATATDKGLFFHLQQEVGEANLSFLRKPFSFQEMQSVLGISGRPMVTGNPLLTGHQRNDTI
jgi:CheY-like chemotaxis protein